MGILWRLVSYEIGEGGMCEVYLLMCAHLVGIVGPPADHLLGYEGVEGARGPRFRKLSPQEIEDYLTNL